MTVSTQENVLQAIDTIVNSSIQKAKYDRTVGAIIDRCTDPLKGEYRVNCNGGLLTVYSLNNETKYEKNDYVNVLIPQSDFSGRKYILGFADQDEIRDTQFFGDKYINQTKHYSLYVFNPDFTPGVYPIKKKLVLNEYPEDRHCNHYVTCSTSAPQGKAKNGDIHIKLPNNASEEGWYQCNVYMYYVPEEES